jgi:hypothetical protein
MEHVYVELQPGDALFFHSNILHRSEANLSEKPRWSIISCYNSLGNMAYNDKSTSWREPVNVVPDEALMAAGVGGAATGGDFLRKEDDPALKATGWEQEVKTI